MKLKKQSLQDKRIIQQERQKLAIEAANLEVEIMKKKEHVEGAINDYNLNNEAIFNEKI